LKILHINNYVRHGGAETVFNITRLNIYGATNVSAFVKDSLITEEPDINFKTWENENKIKGTIDYIFSYYNYKQLKIYLRNNDIDIIHLHGFFSALSPSILKAIKEINRIKPIKVIQTLHDFHLICPNSSLYNFRTKQLCEKCIGTKFKYPILIQNCERRGLIYSIIKAVRSFVSDNLLKHKFVVDHFICPSEFLKEKLIQDGISPAKISVVRNPIKEIQIKIPISQKKNKICYFGRFTREKNLGFLINAFTKWKESIKNDFELVLIGEGEEEEFLYNLKNKSSASDFIKIKRFMVGEQLIKEIEDAKYFCMSSSWYENAPMSVLEAAALNIIPIVPDLGGMKESVEKIIGCGKTYSPNEIDSWINAIEYLEQNYINEFNKLSVSRFIYENNLDNYIKSLEKIYTQKS